MSLREFCQLVFMHVQVRPPEREEEEDEEEEKKDQSVPGWSYVKLLTQTSCSVLPGW